MRALILLILLGACARQEPPEIKVDVVVHVTGEGTIHWNGERVRLADVAARLHHSEDGTTLVVDGAAEADWAHVQWVMAVVQSWSPLGAVTLTHESREPVRLPPSTIYGSYDPYSLLCMQVRRTPHGATEFEMGHRKSTRRDEACRWIGDGGQLMGSYGTFAVEIGGNVPCADVHAVLAAVSRLESVIPEIYVGRPHLWVMLQDPLPATDEFFGRHRDLTQKDLAPLALPLAKKAQEDKDDDPDDRVILDLVPEGLLGEPISVKQIATKLRDAARTYGRIKRLKEPNNPHAGFEKAGPDRLVSKLFVLLRADYDLPWSRVMAVVDTLDEHGFYKLQFATERYATLAHSPEDAARAGVERVEIAPTGWPGLACKLQCFLPTAHDDSERFIEVEVTAAGRFRIDGADFPDVAHLAAEIQTRYRKFDEMRGVTVKGRIVADPNARYQDVISALDAFARAGLEKVDLK